MGTTWASTDEISACNDDLVMAIIEVIAGNVENHLISPEDLFGLNPKQLKKNQEIKEMGPLTFLSPVDAPERKERGPRWRRGDGENEQGRQRRFHVT